MISFKKKLSSSLYSETIYLKKVQCKDKHFDVTPSSVSMYRLLLLLKHINLLTHIQVHLNKLECRGKVHLFQ